MRRPDALAMRQSLGKRTGEELVTSQPQPHNQVRTAQCTRALCGRTSNSRRGDESAVRAPRQSCAVTPTVRYRSCRPDARALRRSLGQRTGQERVASWPLPHNQVRTAQCARLLRGRSSESRRGDERAVHAPQSNADGPKPQPLTRCSGRAAEPRPTNWAGARRELAPATQPSPHRAVLACVLRGRSSESRRGDQRAVRTSRESSAVTPTVRSRSRRPSAVAVRRSLGQRTGQERVASWPQPHNQVRTAQCARVRRGRSSESRWGDERAVHAPQSNADSPKPQPLTRCGDRAAEPRPTNWAGARRELAPVTQSSPHRAVRARAPWAVVRASMRR